MRLSCEQTSAELKRDALSRSVFPEQLDASAYHHLPELADKQLSRVEFPAVIYLLMKQKQSTELMDFSFSMAPSVVKLVCVRTYSKEYPPPF